MMDIFLLLNKETICANFYNFPMEQGNGRHVSSSTVRICLTPPLSDDIRIARQEASLRERQRDLSVPDNPRLLLVSTQRFSNIPDVYKVFIPIREEPTPPTDSERLLEISKSPDRIMAVGKPEARSFLEMSGVIFDERTGHWKHVDHYGNMQAVVSVSELYRLIALTNIVDSGAERLMGAATIAALVTEDRVLEESDPEEYLAKYRGDVPIPRGAAVVGTDPDNGEPRLDLASIPAVRHYFELA